MFQPASFPVSPRNAVTAGKMYRGHSFSWLFGENFDGELFRAGS